MVFMDWDGLLASTPSLTLNISLRLVGGAGEFGLWGYRPPRAGFSTVTKKRGDGRIRSLELEPIGRDG
jgi:hypothetical protein